MALVTIAIELASYHETLQYSFRAKPVIRTVSETM